MARKDIVNPATTVRLWTVTFSSWGYGYFKTFWLRRNALRAAQKFWNMAPYIDLKNEWSGKTVRLKDNPDKVEPPAVILR